MIKIKEKPCYNVTMQYPVHLRKLVSTLKQLPGVGNRSAERFAFHLLEWSPQKLCEMGDIIREIPEKLLHCDTCGCLKGTDSCAFCHNPRRQSDLLCLIASPKDVFAIEETNEYRGLYHVLGVLLSPLDGYGPEHLNLAKLKERIAENGIQEMVIALDSTLEGDATALYIKEELASHNIKISRLAFGLPVGSSLDYIDESTLAKALTERRHF